ncbi:hypothetical protein CAPTEDRAFT_182031 [Capitella teleta]|uniref:Tetraspanin n=1 Tax=Capitella teleta TaxID=283909 RepID=R7VK18_CAPTE|nr:hypothetical protein CAPTEDRAFT_182031 [Capitella teleta]|eukprot:ELU16395.1 hypothetical protein CAPTEDRAFT_182031 [Capitella teleta]
MGAGQGLEGCYSCIKYLMFAFNFLFWLLGCAILGVGIWVRVDTNFKQYVDSNETFNILYTAAYILICVGAIIMVVGFLGCCGAIRESQCMLATFFLFLFIIFIILLGAGIWTIVEKDTLKDAVSQTLKDNVKRYYTDKTESAKKFMDSVQENFNCCGSTMGPIDYMPRLPPSSCLKGVLKPCDSKVFNYIRDNMVIIAGVAIGIGVVMMMGMVLSLCLCCAIRREVGKY